MDKDKIKWVFDNIGQEVILEYFPEDDEWEYSSDYEFFSLKFNEKDRKWSLNHSVPAKDINETCLCPEDIDTDELYFFFGHIEFHLNKVEDIF